MGYLLVDENVYLMRNLGVKIFSIPYFSLLEFLNLNRVSTIQASDWIKPSF